MRRLILLCAAAAACAQNVPLDSRLHPLLERLGEMGYIPSQVWALRPWSVEECRRQLAEARARLDGSNPEAAYLTDLAEKELAQHAERNGVHNVNVYVRIGGVLGEPLTDGWHFGQTWIGDRGRPYGEGWQTVTGFRASARRGRWFAHWETEHQRAAAPPAYDPRVNALTARLDGTPEEPWRAPRGANRGRLMEGYVGVRLGNAAFSVGKQGLWWGPTYDMPLSFSANAEATWNARLSSLHPFRLPWVLARLGPARAEIVLGRLAGHRYTSRPWFNAQKISFKTTPNLELGFTRWSIFWGEGHPITVGSFLRNFRSLTSPPAPGPVDPNDPGDRKGGFDFRYRLPGLRDRLILYADSYSEDDPSPLAAPRRAGVSPGIHLTRIPGWERFDLRVETVSTIPLGSSWNLNYYNGQYRSGNTNAGALVGSWVGRAGRAYQAWTGCRAGRGGRIEFGFRRRQVDGSFLPGGAGDTRGSVKAVFDLRPGLRAEVFFQVERYWVPALGGPKRTVSGWTALVWRPFAQGAGVGEHP